MSLGKGLLCLWKLLWLFIHRNDIKHEWAIANPNINQPILSPILSYIIVEMNDDPCPVGSTKKDNSK